MKSSHLDLSSEVLKPLANAYAALLELADRPNSDLPLCSRVLFGLAELDIYSSNDDQASGPYVELNEYMFYLDDLRNQSINEEQRRYCQEQLQRFRDRVYKFVHANVPETNIDPSIPSDVRKRSVHV